MTKLKLSGHQIDYNLSMNVCTRFHDYESINYYIYSEPQMFTSLWHKRKGQQDPLERKLIYILLHAVLASQGQTHYITPCIWVCVAEGGAGYEQYFNRPDSHKLQTHCGSLPPKTHLGMCNIVSEASSTSSQHHTSPLSASMPCCQILKICLFSLGGLENLTDFIRSWNTVVKAVKWEMVG